MMRDPYEMKVISKRACINAVGGSEALVDRAEKAGLIEFEATPTGRQNTTARQFANLIQFADNLAASRNCD